MTHYTARQIYRFALLAGFSPDQATTMTAIALAESGGDSGAHNPRGEDSRGLWQINARAHPGLGRRDLYDPQENARAAYQVSGQGQDVSPWTTTHGGSAARYVSHRSEAQAAAAASGQPSGLGTWSGTSGYGHPLAAGGGGGSLSASEMAGPGAAPGADDGALRTFLDSALSQKGDAYVWGDEAKVSDADPDGFDCSELIQWAAGRADVDLPDGSWLQYLELQQQNATIDVDQALKTPGALLFSFSSEPTAGGGRPSQAHVAISLGDGRTIEARGTQYGVGSWSGKDRFQYAAVIPGISDGTGGAASLTGGPAASLMAAEGAGTDSDGDGLTDALETSLRLSATAKDSDGDNLSDGYELLNLRSDATRADTDGDAIADSLELALGTNPLDPDSDKDGRLDGAGARTAYTDTDADGVTDELERVLRTDPMKIDSDGDGITDGSEHRAGFDAADPLSNPLTGLATDDPGAVRPDQNLAPEPSSWDLGGEDFGSQ